MLASSKGREEFGTIQKPAIRGRRGQQGPQVDRTTCPRWRNDQESEIVSLKKVISWSQVRLWVRPGVWTTDRSSRSLWGTFAIGPECPGWVRSHPDFGITWKPHLCCPGTTFVSSPMGRREVERPSPWRAVKVVRRRTKAWSQGGLLWNNRTSTIL